MVLCIIFSLAIILLRKRELVALTYMFCDCRWSQSLPYSAVGKSGLVFGL